MSGKASECWGQVREQCQAVSMRHRVEEYDDWTEKVPYSPYISSVFKEKVYLEMCLEELENLNSNRRGA